MNRKNMYYKLFIIFMVIGIVIIISTPITSLIFAEVAANVYGFYVEYIFGYDFYDMPSVNFLQISSCISLFLVGITLTATSSLSLFCYWFNEKKE